MVTKWHGRVRVCVCVCVSVCFKQVGWLWVREGGGLQGKAPPSSSPTTTIRSRGYKTRRGWSREGGGLLSSSTQCEDYVAIEMQKEKKVSWLREVCWFLVDSSDALFQNSVEQLKPLDADPTKPPITKWRL